MKALWYDTQQGDRTMRLTVGTVPVTAVQKRAGTRLGCFWLQNYARARAAGLRFYIEREPGGEAGLCARQANRRQQEVRRGLDVEVRKSLPKFGDSPVYDQNRTTAALQQAGCIRAA